MYEPELHTDLEEISEDECLQLLDRRELGRVAVVVAGQPLIFPVNYALSHRVVTFRTAHGTKLANAPGMNVAFEIDEYDALTGWDGACWSRAWVSMPRLPSTTSPGRHAAAHPTRWRRE